MAQGGVNVDQCTRYAEAAMCGQRDFYARQIAAISSEKQKAKVFRNKTSSQVESILVRLSEEIRKSIIGKYYRNSPGTRIEDVVLTQSSDDNRAGADLFHDWNGVPIAIEVKFGAETSRNIGMDTFDRIFGTDVFSVATSRMIRKEWERLFLDDGRDEQRQLERLWRAINGAIDKFNAFNENRGFVLPEQNQMYMEDTILNTTGDGSFRGEFMKFVLDGNDFSDFKRIPTRIGTWTIDRTERIDGCDIVRCNVFVRNYDTNVEIKYVLNWKNNYPLNGNRADKVPAKLGLGSPSWNVWVEVEVTSIRAA